MATGGMARPQALRPAGGLLHAAGRGMAERTRAANAHARLGTGLLRRIVSPMACSSRTGGERNEGWRRASRQKKGKENARRPHFSWDHGPSRFWQECSGPPEVWAHWGVDELQNPGDPMPTGGAAQQTGPGFGTEAEHKTPEEEFWMYTRTPGPPVDLLKDPHRCILLAEVYVVMFGVGEAQKEGLYSRRTTLHNGLNSETIICFECIDDALRFAGLLEASLPHVPCVQPISPQDLIEFCLDSGYACQLEATGSLLMPPEATVGLGLTDWERSCRLSRGQYTVLAEEPGAEVLSTNTSHDKAHPGTDECRESLDTPTPCDVSGRLAAEIDELRDVLEGLLPEDGLD